MSESMNWLKAVDENGITDRTRYAIFDKKMRRRKRYVKMMRRVNERRTREQRV